MQQPDSWAPPHILQPPTYITAKWEGWAACNCVGNLLSVSVSDSSCLASSLFCANNASCEESSNRLFLVGTWVLSRKIAWSLAAIFSMSSIASSGVFNLIFPPTEASNNCLDCGLKPSMKMFNWISSVNPWVGVFRSKPQNLSSASLKDSFGNWWNEEIAALPSVVFDSEKYFFRNFSTTYSHVFKLFPLKECNHLVASPAKENENKLSLIASSGTPTIFTVLQISI